MYGYLGAAIYWATVPLRYPAYYVWAVVSRVLSVLLSPLWFSWRVFSGTTLMVVNFLSGLKLLFNFFTCAIIVGLVAALTIHGISRLVTMLLSVHPSQQRQQQKVLEEEQRQPPVQQRRIPIQNGFGGGQQQQQQRAQPPIYDDDLDGDFFNDDDSTIRDRDDDYAYVEGNDGDGESLAGSSTGAGGRFGDLGGTTTTTTSSESAFNRPTTASSSRRRGGGVQNSSTSPVLSFGGNDMYRRDWRSLSSNMKSSAGSRRGGSIRSLLAQTIHEESSESDSL
ncbi:hypothetical protein PG993_010341 [Apiospora rasikravindrae]|uniref:TRP C-terminal domain-containing protein n=1 Tax=Apiospora rasikravindrae TaxID=990691 RepID=A0ABR1SN94_9PEZI